MLATCPDSSQAISRPGSRSRGWIELHLGTRVQISCAASNSPEVEDTIAAAFAEVGRIHQLMSFHDQDSDVTRLNRHGVRSAVEVDPRTVAVLRAAVAMSRATDGLFDVTVAAELVRTGFLPQTPGAAVPDAAASWRDIEIESDTTVRFHRSLQIDLGGIAKGYAVDRAFAVCEAAGLVGCVINAGGDIRVGQGAPHLVALDVPWHGSGQKPHVELEGGSIASSCCELPERGESNVAVVHINGVTRRPAAARRFVAVLAKDCMTADALTKSVLLRGEYAAPLLAPRGASALIHEPDNSWLQIPAPGSALSGLPHAASTR
ncbi:MAG: thiamine biosynthesis lipoprotein [Halieaceae bacterium]|jgi:thiamine biosynthesis lipoprotein